MEKQRFKIQRWKSLAKLKIIKQINTRDLKIQPTRAKRKIVLSDIRTNNYIASLI